MISMKRTGLKLLGLCLLTSALMAFSANAAQASSWMVNGKTISTTAENKELEGKFGVHITLLFKFGFIKINVLCQFGTLLNAKLEPAGAISEASKNAKIDLGGCTVTLNGKEAAKCVPTAIGKAAGTIETNEFYGLLQLHSDGSGVIVITPKTGTTFATIHMGAGCAIGEEVSIFGSLALHDVGLGTGKDELEVERAEHGFAEFAPLTALKATNSESESGLTIDVRFDFKTAAGGNWSGLKE